MIDLLPKPIVATVQIPPMQLEVLAPAIDFRPNTESVDDQKAMGSCVAHAGQTALEICYQRAGQPTDLSRMYLYYYVQKASGTLGNVGGGAYTGKLGEAIATAGCCLESTFVYDLDREGREPPMGAFEEARAMFPDGTTAFARVHGLKGIKRALNRGQPVMIGMYVQPGMMYALGKDWRLHEWNIDQMPVGLHAVTVIGYDDSVQRLLVENSWSSSWADGGFFGIKYDYLPTGKVVTESFAFTKLPVPLIPVPEYVAEGVATFYSDTGLLAMPSMRVYFPNFGRLEYQQVVVKITKTGHLTLNDESALHDETNYFIVSENRLVLLNVQMDGVQYQKVTLVGAEYEIISATPI